MARLLTLQIGGVDKTSYLAANSVQVDDELNTRNTLSFQTIDPVGTYIPTVGQTVILFESDGTTRLFAGTIDTINKEIPPGTHILIGNINCVDYNQLCDRFLVAEIYEDKTLEYIVEDILTTYLSAESITTTNVETGPTITKAVFNYTSITQAFNDLSDLTGYDWYIDYNKDLHFFSRETNISPFSLTDSSENYRNIRIESTREQYRNKQYIRGGQDITDSRTESFIGDGTRKTYTLSFTVAETPSSITVNGAAQTIGIGGVDSGKEWYWNKNEKEINQDDGDAALTNVDTLAVTYKGFFPIIVMAFSETEITSRATIEGGSGVYEAILDDPNIDSQDLGTDKAIGLLRRYSAIPTIITFETDTDGLRAGQLINIVNSENNLNNDYLIERVSANDIATKFLRYQVTALSGERVGGWAHWFAKIFESTRKFVIRENEVLMKLLSFTDEMTCSESLDTPTTGTPSWVIGSYIIGYCEVE